LNNGIGINEDLAFENRPKASIFAFHIVFKQVL
jgi:hypothetical protein